MAKKKITFEQYMTDMRKAHAAVRAELAEVEDRLKEFRHLPGDVKVPLLKLRAELREALLESFDNVAGHLDLKELGDWIAENNM